jgi:hypothetical protein
MDTPASFLLTKKALSIIAFAIALLMWFFKAAKGLHLPFGMTTDDVLTGLGNIGILLGVGGSSYLPGGTLLKSAAAVQSQAANAMKTIAILFWAGVLSLGVALASCATTGTPTPGPATSVPVQIAADCAAPAVRDVATHLVDDVASALLTSGDWHQALANLGATETQRLKVDAWPAIMCAIQEIGARTGMQLAAKASMDQDAQVQTQTLHDRAVQWAAEHRAT